MLVNKLIPVICIASLLACNSPQTDTSATGADTMGHDGAHGPMESSTAIAPVPDVPEGANVHFVNLKDGQTVSTTFLVVMGTEKMRVDTANGIVKPGSGHHHILIDGPDAYPAGEVVPKDSVHLHFGNAQQEAELTLTPGKHTLTLQYADALHRSYGDKLSKKISIHVKE